MKILQNTNNRPSVFFALRTKIDILPLPQKRRIETKSIDVGSCCNKGIDYLQAFGDLSDTDPLKNDIFCPLFHRYLDSDGADFYLEKFSSTWEVKAEITGTDAKAKYFDWGFFTNGIASFKGIQLQWRGVLAAYGQGFYRVRVELSNGTWYSQIYCLKPYSDIEADGSTRFDWTVQGNRSCVYDKNERVDYGNINWPDQIRVNGMFGFETDDQEEIEVRFETGQLSDIRNTSTIKYEFKGVMNNYRSNESMSYNAFISNNLYATDYCLLNDNPNYKMVAIKRKGSFAPTYYVYNLLNNVSVEFRNRVDNVGYNLC